MKKSKQNLRSILENKILVNAVQKYIESSNTSWSRFISETEKQNLYSSPMSLTQYVTLNKFCPFIP